MTLRELSEQIVEDLNAIEEKFINFTAVRAYNPRVVLEKVTTLKVLVVPRSIRTQRNDETGWDETYAVDIGIVKKLPQREIRTGTEDVADIDPLMKLVEQLADYFKSEAFKSPAGYDLIEVKNDPIYSVEHLVDNRQFTSVLTLEFQGFPQFVMEEEEP